MIRPFKKITLATALRTDCRRMKDEAETSYGVIVAISKVRDDGGSAQSSKNGGGRREREREGARYMLKAKPKRFPNG